MAHSLSDLAIVGAQAVRQAFRLGVYVAEMSQNLNPCDLSGSHDSWAYVLADLTADQAQKELDAVQEKEVGGVGSRFVLMTNHRYSESTRS